MLYFLKTVAKIKTNNNKKNFRVSDIKLIHVGTKENLSQYNSLVSHQVLRHRLVGGVA